MLNDRTFADILDENLKTLENESTDFTPYYEGHLEAYGLGKIHSLLSQEAPNAPIAKSVQQAYPICKKAVLRPAHRFTELQNLAFSTLQRYSQSLKNNFNLQELKSAYRLSVLQTHPDQGGSSESFQAVRKSYQILLSLVKN